MATAPVSLLLMAATGLVSSCSAAQLSPLPPLQERCAALNGMSIAPSSISMPTNGARITSARTQSGEEKSGNYCHAAGTILSVDPAAPPIRFEIGLPGDWNGKALMLTGGGFDGIVPAIDIPLFAQPAELVAAPLSRGYAVFASDSGHQGTTEEVVAPLIDASFALNDEARDNYAGDALIKTYDAAHETISGFYGQPARYRYIAGGSNGGREGLLAISAWPDRFDGAIVAYPFWGHATTSLSFGAVWRQFKDAGAYLTPDDQELFQNFIYDSCDGLDGLKDGVIARPDACRPELGDIACTDRKTDRCLAPMQIEALKRFDGPVDLSWKTAGEKSHPGFPIFQGADIRGQQQMGNVPPQFPIDKEMPTTAQFYDQFMRYFVLRDPTADPWDIDPENPGKLATTIESATKLLDVPPSGFDAFRRKGGKLIIFQGLADPIVSPRTTADFWHRVGEAAGTEERDRFARYYIIPGYGHGAGGTNAFQPSWDQLGVLEDWVEHGTAPGPLTMTDFSQSHFGRTRPICRFGRWTSYQSGDPRSSNSFACIPNASDEHSAETTSR
ncbi:MAG: tannase/feruloyl esterase family alpha/beta hydrolase [Henriciella sp.]|uniref:tannase/feruloyl esterase family alpha/beta hydrolase n=1 Tax=Henriciella sp. TaxID=1968823 RepID=UPI003C715B9C